MFFTGSSDFNERVFYASCRILRADHVGNGCRVAHDEVIQKLTSMSLYIERIERSAGDASEILNLVTRMRSEFDNVTQSVRAISNRFHPVQSTYLSFNNSIIQLCDVMQRPGNGTLAVPQLATSFQLASFHSLTSTASCKSLSTTHLTLGAWKVDVIRCVESGIARHRSGRRWYRTHENGQPYCVVARVNTIPCR